MRQAPSAKYHADYIKSSKPSVSRDHATLNSFFKVLNTVIIMFCNIAVTVVLALLVVTLGMPNADEVKCFPEKWSGVVVGKLAIKQGSKDVKAFHMVADWYADYTKKMESIHESLYLGKDHVGNYTYLRDGNKVSCIYHQNFQNV